MLKKRVIPIILFDGKYAVQTVQFGRPPRRLGPVDQFVNNMGKRDIDELVIIDILASEEGRKINFKQIKHFTKNMFCPVSYGGGIRSLDDIKTLIKYCGVDKVILKTSLFLVSEASHSFGSQAIVYAMDCYPHHSNGTHFVHRQFKSMGPSDFVEYLQRTGAGEILLTCMDHQGKMEGYNYLLINQISKVAKVPLIANGGCGKVGHMLGAIEAGADAVAASSVFALTDLTPREAARGLREAGYPTRLDAANGHQRQAGPRRQGA